MIPIAFVENLYSPVVKTWQADWEKLSNRLACCDIGKKAGGGWMPADIEPGPRTGKRVKSISLLVLDVEANAEPVKDDSGKPLLDANGDKVKRVIGPEPPAVSAILAEVALWGWRCILHTSYSFTEEHPRYRLVFYPDRQLNPAEVEPLGKHVAALLGIGDCLDTGALEPARLFYLPRCPADRIDGFRHADTQGAALPVDELLAEAARINEANKPATTTRRTGKSAGVIEAFNAARDIGAILEQHGYKPHGRRRWLWAGSTTGLPGVRLLPDAVPERVYSSHGGDPLADEHAHDAFDVFRILQHNGDWQAAVKAAAAMLGITGQYQPGAKGATGEFQEPIPLQRPMPEPTAFPVDALGKVLGDAARKMAEAIQAPMAICGNSVLAAATLATQGLADVVIDGRCFPLSEIFKSIGETGERKSAVDKVALWPHREYENELRQAYEEQFSDYNRAKEAYEKARDEAIVQGKSKTYQDKKNALDALKDVEPHKPLEPFLICEEPTYEGLVKMLAHGQPSIGLFSDEGGRFIGGHGMNNDNLLKTAAGMSGLWDGKPISRVRAGDGAALLSGRRVSCHLMAQPDVSRLMLSNAVLLEQGLLSRCLVTWPASTAGTRLYREVDLSQSPELKAYNRRMFELLRMPLPMREGARNELNPRQLALDQDAKRLWITFHDAVETKLADGGELAAIKGLANKAPEHAARLAGALAVFDTPTCQSIGLQSMKAGIKLVTHYIQEAQRLFGSGVADQQMVEAEKLLKWLRQRKDSKGQPDRYASLVEIYQRGPNGIRTAKAARALMTVLENHGYVMPYPDGVEYDGTTRREAWKVRG